MGQFNTMRLLEEFLRAWQSRYPIVWIQTWDERRVEQQLRLFAEKIVRRNPSMFVWTCLDGWSGQSADTRDPLVALDFVLQYPDPAVFLMKDFAIWVDDTPQLIRKLRDVYYDLRTAAKMVVITTPRGRVPEMLERQIYYIPVDIPTPQEIAQYLQHWMARRAEWKRWIPFIPRMADALRGLTFDEVFHFIQRLSHRPPETEQALLDAIFLEKEQIIRKQSVLEFVPARWSLDDLGGMDNLKVWLQKRKPLFSVAAREQHLPKPRGILIMGISGCGKSLAIKCISSLWNLPLFRLDMNLVLSGAHGAPEWVFHQALQQVEALSPAILWIDEIEMGVGRYHETGAEGRSHIFATFLTWMQERSGDVFIAATANRIHLLPAEMLRKGRFDQIFYVDLPTDEERKEIFRIHLRKQGADPNQFDLVALAAMTRGWTGAEIEQAVVTARIEALHAGTPLSMDHLITAVGQIVPLSKTMEDQIKAIKAWAYDRAMPASSEAARRYR